VKDDQGTPIAMVGIIRDITDRKRAEERLAQKTSELEALQRRVRALCLGGRPRLEGPLVSH